MQLELKVPFSTCRLPHMAHPSQVQGPASGLAVLMVARTDTMGLPLVVSPQLCTVSVPLAAAPERHLARKEGTQQERLAALPWCLPCLPE